MAPGGLSEAFDGYAQTCESHGVAVQPFIAAEGTSWHEVTVYYVVLTKDVFYSFQNFKEALTCAFHALWALYAPYPKEAEYVWFVLQRVVFEMKSAEHDVKLEKCSVMEVIDEITGFQLPLLA